MTTIRWKCTVNDTHGKQYVTVHANQDAADAHADWAIGCEYIQFVGVEPVEFRVADGHVREVVLA